MSDIEASSSIAERYAVIVDGLDASQVAAVWCAVLYGRTPLEASLSGPVERLRVLRDEIGKRSAAKRASTFPRGDAA